MVICDLTKDVLGVSLLDSQKHLIDGLNKIPPGRVWAVCRRRNYICIIKEVDKNDKK